MEGTVRTVVATDDGFLVAVRWDDGTISEGLWTMPMSDLPPDAGDRVRRDA